jgi:glucose/mannose-6-phosphate isomerase
MFETYDKWPNIAEKFHSIYFPKIDIKNIENIVFAGMGGSGTIGDVFSSILSKTNMHVTVVKGYLLPKTVNEKTLVVCTSISGNTKETLSILENSKKMKTKFIGLSSGGMMEEFCRKNNVEHFKIEENHSPRASLLGFLYSALNILEDTIPINKNEVDESIKELYKIRKRIGTEFLDHNNIAVNLGEWIKDIPIVYYPWGLQSAAIRFKNSMQENAKKHVMYEDIIEACHNGIVAWEKSSNVQPILIQGIDDHTKTKERWNVVKEYFDSNKIEYREINSVSGSVLSKLVCLIYTLDFTSIYNSVSRGIDPSPVKSIDFIKNKII